MEQRNVDPLLEEVDEMRRRIMAEHDNDYRKVLRWYAELGREHKKRAAEIPEQAEQDRSSA
ncbi:MAG TPA: hypothetical protein VHG08_23455 [Longimicrobium sp.]|nr:hypothetical protein [Longimicrobium sp.]